MTKQIYNVRFISNEPNLVAPRNGQIGRAWRASGHSDPDSCEHGAWLFEPNDDPERNAYYCEFNDIQIAQHEHTTTIYEANNGQD